MRRLVRALGTLLIVAGLGTLGWAFTVWQWQDPFTSLYTRLEQRDLEASYERRVAEFDNRPNAGRSADLAAERRQLRADARRYRKTSRRGEAIGRLTVPRMGLDMVIVNGTDHETLKKGPGRYLGTFMPGEGELIYVAGHRTTYSAPFSHIDRLRPGDRVTVDVPYGTFEYRITRHAIVRDDQLEVLKSKGKEVLALQACHPRFFATHRYIAYAEPVRVTPRGGVAFAVAAARSAKS